MTVNCPRCLLPLLSGVNEGRDTAFLFASLHCQCHKRVAKDDSVARSKISTKRCAVCGKARAVSGRHGSFTAYLFQEFRCRCNKKASKDSGKRGLSAEQQANLSTQHYLSQAGDLTTTRRQQARLARTEMVLKSSDSQAIDTLEGGEVIAGSYILEEKIAQGGMGMVFKARHRLLGRPCALKFLLPSVISPASWEMFKREAKILNELEHPAFCKIYDMGLHRGNLPFYAMEFLSGITLEDLLNRQGTISLGAALEIFIEIGGALAYSHRQKIIHRDVKPANIMLVRQEAGTRDDGCVVVKLLDFGIAELCETASATKEVIGSASYMSPEQFGAQALTPATDIYSLACSFFEALSGRVPFDGLDFKELAIQHQQQEAPSLRAVTGCEFPQEIEAILHHALSKDPERRYRYMSELVVDLERVLEGKPLQFARLDELDDLSRESRLAKGKRRKGFVVGTGLAVACVGVLAVGGIALHQLRSPAAIKNGNLGAVFFPKAINAGVSDYDQQISSSSFSSVNNTVKGDDYAIIGEVTGELNESDDLDAALVANFNNRGRAVPALEVKYRDIILKKLKANAYKNVPGVALDYDAYLHSCGSAEAYKASGLPVSAVINEGKEKVRVFLFPQKGHLGYYSSYYEWGKKEATGIVLYPAAIPIDLAITNKYADSSRILQRFDPCAVSWLTLFNCKSLPELTSLRSWKKLSSLELRMCKLSDVQLIQLQALGKVKSLHLLGCEFSMKDLEESHLLESLDIFTYLPSPGKGGFKDLLSVLTVVRHRLSSLLLSGELKEEDILSLQHIKTVSTLKLYNSDLTDEKLALLSNLQFVDELILTDSELDNCSPQAVANFKAALGAKLRGDDRIHL